MWNLERWKGGLVHPIYSFIIFNFQSNWNEIVDNFDDIFDRLGDVAYQCVDVIQRDYGLSEQDAKKLFEHVWIYTFGIGALCATGMCSFSEEQVIEMLGHDFIAMLVHIKSGQMNQPTVYPTQNTEE